MVRHKKKRGRKHFKGCSGRGTPHHEKAAAVHSYQRLELRYGVRDRLDQRVLLSAHTHLIQTGRFELLGKRDDGSDVVKVTHEGRDFYLAWRADYGFVVTYLTMRQAYRNADLGFLL